MLTLNGHRFATGQTTYTDIHPERVAGKQAIYIQVILPIDTGMGVYAMVDTGAPYCIFDTELVEVLGLSSDDGEKIPLLTAHGRQEGSIHRMTIQLPAEQGESLEIDTSVYVTDEPWSYGNFLGYSAFLARFRFAVDLATNTFYFGAYDDA